MIEVVVLNLYKDVHVLNTIPLDIQSQQIHPNL